MFALYLLGFAGDALAWGLQTHVFYAQYVLLAVAFADPDFRRAAARLPRLVLAGACLPDLSLAGRVLGTPAFRRAHQWATLRRFTAAGSDEERAIAIGYASHLAADVVAHNRFVPEHERRIADIPHVTHALCEWAMDEHVKHALQFAPGRLLAEEISLLTPVAAKGFRCSEALAGSAIRLLTRGERFLRASPLPRLSRRVLGVFDRQVAPRFEAYLHETFTVLRGVGELLESADPRCEAEPPRYAMTNEAPAMIAPSAAPARTSVG